MVNVYVFANGILVINERCESHRINNVVTAACRKCAVDAEDYPVIQVQVI